MWLPVFQLVMLGHTYPKSCWNILLSQVFGPCKMSMTIQPLRCDYNNVSKNGYLDGNIKDFFNPKKVK